MNDEIEGMILFSAQYQPGVVVEVAVLARQCSRPRIGGDCHHAQLCVIVYRVLRDLSEISLITRSLNFVYVLCVQPALGCRNKL